MNRQQRPLDRAGFFRSLRQTLGRLVDEFAGEYLEETAARLEQHFPLLIRPPGALPEESFLKTCRRCGECVRACPHFAIRVYFRSPSFFEKTPYLEPRESFCRMCEDFPCIRACPSGALQRPDKRLPRIGTATVQEALCLNVSHPSATPCRACVDICPGRFSALQAPEVGNRAPRVLVEACSGCGACVSACPARPDPAVCIVPR
ncbi:MAG TPA: 4Fe-4S dicluster domain-containing protein [Candidatus Ozemobacteraceae bacterium]|mgnify:CR=1 FL=1|nr:4Fe-4S dicluster domain-containing protein [Candidatus Ozemobacteraceae bacterium]